jgi:uncharacterized protein YkwD
MRRLRFTLPATAAALAALAIPAAASASAATPCKGANIAPTAKNAAAVRHATLCLLNRQRVRHGLHRLHAQRPLGSAATKYARLMVKKGFFAHVSPGGSTMVQRIERTSYLRGAHGWWLGENLAWGSGASATPAKIVDAWMHSAGHRRNILDRRFRHIGIGVALGAPAHGAGATYATEFGAKV